MRLFGRAGCIFWVCTLSFFSSLNFAFAAEYVTLDKYLDLVREKNSTLLANIHTIETAYYGVRASVSSQRPALSAGAGVSYLSGQERAEQRERDITASNIEIRLSWRIDVSGVYTLDEQQQILSYENQRARFDDSVNTLMAAAEDAYWSAVVERENAALQNDVLRRRRESLRVTEEKYKQRMIPRLDMLRAESQAAAAESFVSRAESRYRNALETMAELAGGVKVIPAEDILEIPVAANIAELENAVLFRPDVRAGRITLERGRILKRLAAKGLSPTLDLGASYMPSAEPGYSSSPQRGEMSMSLRLSIPIADGNETRYRVLAAERTIMSDEQRLKSLENGAVKEFAVALNNWNDALVFEKDKKRQVERSDEELAIAQLLYNEGMGAQIDLLNAQTDNQQVRTEHLYAIREMYAALVAMRKAAGDYAPNEDGSWKVAAAVYGRGNKESQAAPDYPAFKIP